MVQHSYLQIQLLEKLGAPLLAAAAAVIARKKKEGRNTDKQEAEHVAALMSKAVQASISLAGSMALKESGEAADSIRLALVAVTGPLVAEQYRRTEKLPNDKDVERLVKALEVVLTFSDSFAPAAENAARLENIEPAMGPVDENQINIQFVNMLVPVVNAVASFPFGHLENKLVQEISGKLVIRATAIRKSLLGEDSAAQFSKQAELHILKALVALYVECHGAEMNKLMAMDEQERTKAAEAGDGILSMDSVWQAFEIRAEMIEVIGKNIAPGSDSSSKQSPSTSPDIAAAPPPQAEPPEKPVLAEAPVTPVDEFIADVEAKSEPKSEPEAEEEGDASFNPMGFFKPGAQSPPPPPEADAEEEDV